MKDRYEHSQDALDPFALRRHEAKLRALLREARPVPEPSAELAQRILDRAVGQQRAWEQRGALLCRPGMYPRSLRLIGSLALTAALALCLLLWPHSRNSNTGSAQVAAALADVATWHLKGWKLLNGRRVPWEIWGRRNPFFYREQIGEEVVLDDGGRRIRVIPADRQHWRNEAIVLQMPSRPGLDNVGWAYAVLAEKWRAAVRPWKETPQTAVFKFSDGPGFEPAFTHDFLYTVNKQNWLPQHYEVRRGDHRTEWTAEYLEAEYNRPLSAQVAALQWSKGARIIDALHNPDGARVPHDNVSSANGLTVQATPLAIDTQGDVLIRLRGWLGDVPLTDGPSAPLHMKVYAVHSWIAGTLPVSPYHDQAGNAYVLPDLPLHLLNLPDGDHLLLFAPLEPLTEGSALPQRLTIQLTASPCTWTAMAGMPANWTQELPLFAEELIWSVPLPQTASKIALETYLPARWRRQPWLPSAHELEAAIARAREVTRRRLAGK